MVYPYLPNLLKVFAAIKWETLSYMHNMLFHCCSILHGTSGGSHPEVARVGERQPAQLAEAVGPGFFGFATGLDTWKVEAKPLVAREVIHPRKRRKNIRPWTRVGHSDFACFFVIVNLWMIYHES